jgi:hypothetical protein
LTVTGKRGMDNSNQVKVFLHGHKTDSITTKSGKKRAPYNSQEFFERELWEN